MDKIKIYIKDKYGLSNYQMAQLTFVIKSTSSELSKILLMGIAFQNHLKLYIFLLIIMCFLRTFSGGLHFYTYKKCLLASTTYMGVIIFFFSKILLPLYVQLLLLTVCIMSCYSIGPVLSKYRTHFPRKQLYFCRNITCLNIFMYRILPIAKEWQNRLLEKKYAVVFMDAVHFHVRQDSQTVKKDVYVAIEFA